MSVHGVIPSYKKPFDRPSARTYGSPIHTKHENTPVARTCGSLEFKFIPGELQAPSIAVVPGESAQTAKVLLATYQCSVTFLGCQIPALLRAPHFSCAVCVCVCARFCGFCGCCGFFSLWGFRVFVVRARWLSRLLAESELVLCPALQVRIFVSLPVVCLCVLCVCVCALQARPYVRLFPCSVFCPIPPFADSLVESTMVMYCCAS